MNDKDLLKALKALRALDEIPVPEYLYDRYVAGLKSAKDIDAAIRKFGKKFEANTKKIQEQLKKRLEGL